MGIKMLSGSPSPSEFDTHHKRKSFKIQGEVEDPRGPSTTKPRRASGCHSFSTRGECQIHTATAGPMGPGVPQRSPEPPGAPEGFRRPPGGGPGGGGGRGGPGGRNRKEDSKRQTQFSKYVFGFSELGSVLNYERAANLVNCAVCLENDFLNSAASPPSPPGPAARRPPEASGGPGDLRGPLRALQGPSARHEPPRQPPQAPGGPRAP